MQSRAADRLESRQVLESKQRHFRTLASRPEPDVYEAALDRMRLVSQEHFARMPITRPITFDHFERSAATASGHFTVTVSLLAKSAGA